MKLCQIHKKCEPELERNTPMRYNFNGVTNILWKQSFLCENVGTGKTLFSYHFSSQLLWETNVLSQTSFPKYCLPKARITKQIKAKCQILQEMTWFLSNSSSLKRENYRPTLRAGMPRPSTRLTFCLYKMRTSFLSGENAFSSFPVRVQ